MRDALVPELVSGYDTHRKEPAETAQEYALALEDPQIRSVVPAEGRIEPEDGTLMCSYHGWRFRGDGACTVVPQALDEKANAAACSNSRSCAVSHPTQVPAAPALPRAGAALHSLSVLCGMSQPPVACPCRE